MNLIITLLTVLLLTVSCGPEPYEEHEHQVSHLQHRRCLGTDIIFRKIENTRQVCIEVKRDYEAYIKSRSKNKETYTINYEDFIDRVVYRRHNNFCMEPWTETSEKEVRHDERINVLNFIQNNDRGLGTKGMVVDTRLLQYLKRGL